MDVQLMAFGKKEFFSLVVLDLITSVPLAWGLECEQSVLGVGGVFEDGGSSPGDSATKLRPSGAWFPLRYGGLEEDMATWDNWQRKTS